MVGGRRAIRPAALGGDPDLLHYSFEVARINEERDAGNSRSARLECVPKVLRVHAPKRQYWDFQSGCNLAESFNANRRPVFQFAFGLEDWTEHDEVHSTQFCVLGLFQRMGRCAHQQFRSAGVSREGLPNDAWIQGARGEMNSDAGAGGDIGAIVD